MRVYQASICCINLKLSVTRISLQTATLGNLPFWKKISNIFYPQFQTVWPNFDQFATTIKFFKKFQILTLTSGFFEGIFEIKISYGFVNVSILYRKTNAFFENKKL